MNNEWATTMTILLDCADAGTFRTAYHSRIDGLLDILFTPPSDDLLALVMRADRCRLAERQYARATA